MEVDGGGGEPAAFPGPIRGKKRPPSPSTLPSDSEDSPRSTTSDEDDDGWAFSDEEEDAEDLYQGKYRPFTVDDFPRVSTDDAEQTYALYRNPELRLRGPPPLRRICAFKGDFKKHSCGRVYRLNDESEINVNNARNIDCSNGCQCHPMNLLQFFDLKIAGYHHTQPGCANIFGFFAARDMIEPLRNYVYRREIDNYEPVTVKLKTGMARLSLTSPVRGICMTSHVLFDFKLFVRTEDLPEDGPKGDLLIDGCAEFSNLLETTSFIQTRRLYGEKCGLDVKFAVLINAVQAFVDVEVLHAPSCGFNLNLYAKTSGFKDVIRLSQGVVQAGCKMSSVVAVTIDGYLDLRMEGSPKDGFGEKLACYMWGEKFECCYHGTANNTVKLDEFTTISVKISWKTID